MQNGWASEIYALDAPFETTPLGTPVHKFSPDRGGLGVIRKLGRSQAMAKGLGGTYADIFHIHGLWMMPNVYPAKVARQLNKPLLLAPRGMLGREALQFSSFAKKAFWLLWQRRVLNQVSCFHATAESEYEDIRSFGLKGPVAIIPNGVDLPNMPESKSRPGARPYVLSLGRLHPKKGLETLIMAFSKVASDFPDWQLRIIGMDEGGYSEKLASCVKDMNLLERVSIEAPVFGADKVQVMEEAGVFALPSLHENFAVTVAESLAVETPVISSKGAPWAGLETHRCGWWIDKGIEPLEAALRKALSLSDVDRRYMGQRGRKWVEKEFAWSGIGENMSQVYRWLSGHGPKPSVVVG